MEDPTSRYTSPDPAGSAPPQQPSPAATPPPPVQPAATPPPPPQPTWRPPADRGGSASLIFGVIISGFTVLKLDAYYQEMVKGAIIVGAVVLDQWRQRRAAARM